MGPAELGGGAVNSVEFFRGFVRNPRGVGYVVPSSRALARNLITASELGGARVIVEYGAGTGILTQEILEAMPWDCKLIAMEIDPRFATLLRKRFRDPRLTIYQGSAVELAVALGKIEADCADVVISGIPFSTLSLDLVREILATTRENLRVGGRFSSYQFRSHARALAEPYFGAARVRAALWNLPPMRIYTWIRGAETDREQVVLGHHASA